MKMLNSSRTPFLRVFFVGISQLSLYIAIFFSPIVIMWFIRKNNQRKGHFILVIMIGCILIWELFNLIIFWPRPQTSIALTQSYSYPSGHVFVGVCFYLSLSFVIIDSLNNSGNKIIGWSVPVIIITMISLSRMYLRAHYPADVIGGIVIGILWLLTVVLCFDKIEILLIKAESSLKMVFKVRECGIVKDPLERWTLLG
jgi:undecaprenyl-diphosphatase